MLYHSSTSSFGARIRIKFKILAGITIKLQPGKEHYYPTVSINVYSSLHEGTTEAGTEWNLIWYLCWCLPLWMLQRAPSKQSLHLHPCCHRQHRWHAPESQKLWLSLWVQVHPTENGGENDDFWLMSYYYFGLDFKLAQYSNDRSYKMFYKCKSFNYYCLK